VRFDIDNNTQWGNGEQIVCNLCPKGSFQPDAGLCAFPQEMKNGERISGKSIKSAVQALVDYKCGIK
jgi:hypothetical protein